MRRTLILIPFLLSFFLLQGQNTNISKLGQIDYQSLHNSDISDIWGYVDSNGNEYAIVGVNDTGVSIVDVTNPGSATEVYYSEEQSSTTWRDIKTYNDHAYIVNEGGGGLKIIDLSPLPGSTNLSDTTYTGPSGSTWSTAHNIYIDSSGIAYIFGSDRGNGGVIMLDLAGNPMSPVEVGTYDQSYVHDGMVRNDTLYACHINDGEFRIVDVSNPSSPQVLGSHSTPNDFSHNAWVADDGDHLYTTDEVSDGYIGAYDVSDPSNIMKTDRIQVTPGSGSIPHNTHFWNEYLITSYYRDGVVIHDVSKPGNMVEVGRFDTSPGLSGDGFNGAWGVYPWLPSGNLIVSDIENGLFILGPTYERGCYLEGTVTDKSDGTPINDAKVNILPDSIVEHSDITGAYANGILSPGTYDVRYSHPAYFPDTVSVSLSQNSTVTKDVQLKPRPEYTVRIEFEAAANGNSLKGAQALMRRKGLSFSGTSNSNGVLVLNNVYQGTYELDAGKWGYGPYCQDSLQVNGPDTLHISLTIGYADDFNLDFGWKVQSSSNTGHWERGEPNGTSFNSLELNPDYDITGDCGDQAFVTGNQGTQPTDDEVDSASTTLMTPKMDLSAYEDPTLTFQCWFISGSFSGIGGDSLFISMHGGGMHTIIDTVPDQAGNWGMVTVDLKPYGPFSDSMEIHFRAADPNANTVTEAGVDEFRIEGYNTAVKASKKSEGRLQVSPVPFKEHFRVQWSGKEKARAELYDMQGRRLQRSEVTGGEGRIDAASLPSGVYILVLKDPKEGTVIGREEVVKE